MEETEFRLARSKRLIPLPVEGKKGCHICSAPRKGCRPWGLHHDVESTFCNL